MISRSFCWAIMKKMTKKWNLETSNVETELKIGIYAKNWARQVLLKNFNLVKVNGQQSTIWSKSTVNEWRVLTWQCDVTLGLMWQYVKRSRRVGRVEVVCPSAWGAWEIQTAHRTRAREAETSAGVWGHVWGGFWPFLVGFFSGLAVLSLYAFALIVGWAKWWDPRVAGTVSVTTVTCF